MGIGNRATNHQGHLAALGVISHAPDRLLVLFATYPQIKPVATAADKEAW
jgi:hypothetical protein